MNAGGIHFSYPSAARCAEFFYANGYRATSIQLVHGLRPGHETIGVNTAVAMLREAVWRMGLSREENPVECHTLDVTEDGRQVKQYVVPPEYRRWVNALVWHERANPTPRGKRPDLARMGSQLPGQVPLFK